MTNVKGSRLRVVYGHGELSEEEEKRDDRCTRN